MTVTYTAQVASSGFSNFFRLLGRWRGSIYKLVWMDLILFLSLFVILAISYRLLMNDAAQRVFEGIVDFAHIHGQLIPLSFVLGFYVRIVMDRWWDQYMTIPWPDALAILVSAHIQGEDERARVMRRTIMRYTCLCQVIVFTMISPGVKRRFPGYQQIIEAGLLQENEKDIIEMLDVAFPQYPKHWMPIVWAASIVMRARREGHIRDDYAVKSIIDELNKFRGLNGYLLYYDWVSVPLVYTQVVTLATYLYFLITVIGQQWTRDPKSRAALNFVDQYFPFFTTLQFFFYMGWLKVAESLINPFGEDDDDFELNWMIDRNLTVSYLIVDEMHQEFPELVKDQYWDEVFPPELPYTDESQRVPPPEASTAKLDYTNAPMQDRISESRIRRRTVSSETVGMEPMQHKMYSSDSTFETLSRFSGSSRDTFQQSRTSIRAPRLSTAPSSKRGSSFGEIPLIPGSLSFDELIAQRRNERHERNRSYVHNVANSSPGPRVFTVLVQSLPTSSSERETSQEDRKETRSESSQD